MHDNIDFSNMATTQDVVNILSKLSFNVDNFEKVYYNMYLEETPMDIVFRQYDSEGVMNELIIPNIAKMKTTSYTSNGNPNGQIQAPKGSICIDILSGDPYYKKEGSDTYGWILLWTKDLLGDQNSSADKKYLTPNGDASKLVNLNINNLKENPGTLSVNFGGTSVTSLLAGRIIKGNGANPFSIAIDSIDYLGPDSTTGIIMFYPPMFGENGELKIPNGWLICDGKEYSGATGSTYKKLYDVIGIIYGGDISTSTFKVPNLLNYFPRCINSTAEGTCRAATDVQTSQNKTHTHGVGTFALSNANATHSHGASSNSTGDHYHGAMGEKTDQHAGDFGYYSSKNNHWGTEGDVDHDNTLWKTSTDGAHSHTITVTDASATHTHTISGNSASEGNTVEFNVLNMPLVPIIKF